MEEKKQGYNEFTIEGRNAVIEAFRSGKTIDKVYILDGCQDGPIMTIKREAKKQDTMLKYVAKERLDQMSETGKHQGVIAIAAAYEYAQVEDMLALARKKGEPPFLFLLDNIEDPHNLGAIIRTANLAGAHGVIIPKNRAAGLTATVARTSAGALNYTPVAKVTNLAKTIEELKEEGLWFVCADMGGTRMYDLNLTGPIGLVIGNEGEGVGRLVKEKCDMVASIPMKGDIDSLNASVAAGVLAYEIEEETDYVWLQEEIKNVFTNVSKEPTILSKSAIAFDRSSKAMLYGKNYDKEVPMASTTKIMTAIIFVENNKNLNEEIEVCKQAAIIGGSRLGLKTGDKITKEDLLYGLMLCSRE